MNFHDRTLFLRNEWVDKIENESTDSELEAEVDQLALIVSSLKLNNQKSCED